VCIGGRVSYPLATLVFSLLVFTFKSGLTLVAQLAIYTKPTINHALIQSYRFRGAFHLDKAHSAVASHRKSLVVAEPGDLHSITEGVKTVMEILTLLLRKPGISCKMRPPITQLLLKKGKMYLDRLAINIDVKFLTQLLRSSKHYTIKIICKSNKDKSTSLVVSDDGCKGVDAGFAAYTNSLHQCWIRKEFEHHIFFLY